MLIQKYEKLTPQLDGYIVSSTDPGIRYAGSSGGFVTELVRYLFTEKRITNALSFQFAGKTLYEPILVNSFDDYLQTASIYHDMPIVNFIRKNISAIGRSMFLTCLPCQIAPIRRILQSQNIESFIVSLVCSGQLTKQATFDFLKTHNIDIAQIHSFRYRGDGWPSGIHIEMNNSKKHFFHNTESDWKCFLHSSIYNLDRCFRCQDTLGKGADFSAADPWLKRYMQNDFQGSTLVCTSQERGKVLIEEMISRKRIELHYKIGLQEIIESQLWTYAKKESFQKFILLRFLLRLFRTKYYRRLFLFSCYRHYHYKLYMRILKYFKRKLHV